MPRIYWTFNVICSSFVQMRDFAEKYRKVVHFGLSSEESADMYGEQDAWAILASAVKRTVEEDVRSADLDDALGYLSKYATRKRPFRDFRDALSIVDPVHRFQALKDAAERIARVLSG